MTVTRKQLPRRRAVWQRCSHPELRIPAPSSHFAFPGAPFKATISLDPLKLSDLRPNHLISNRCLLPCSLCPAPRCPQKEGCPPWLTALLLHTPFLGSISHKPCYFLCVSVLKLHLQSKQAGGLHFPKMGGQMLREIPVAGMRITKCRSLCEESMEIQREIRQNPAPERIKSSSKEKCINNSTTTTIPDHCSVRQNQCNKAGKRNMERGDNIVIYEF